MWEENTEEEEMQIGRKLRWDVKRRMEEADEWLGYRIQEEDEEEEFGASSVIPIIKATEWWF